MRITGELDKFDSKEKLATHIAGQRYTGNLWLSSIAKALASKDTTMESFIRFDLSGMEWINQYEWCSFLALVETTINQDPLLKEVHFDFGKDNPNAEPLIRFSESLFARQVLMSGNVGRPSVLYPFFNVQNILSRFSYSGEQGAPSVVGGIASVATKSDCRRFLDADSINSWRNALSERSEFKASPLFKTDEVWRVFCHELAVNIKDHAQVRGFVAARALNPLTPKGELRKVAAMAFPEEWWPLIKNCQTGILECCVSDAGDGIVRTLGSRFSHLLKLEDPTAEVRQENILAFAFDEYGTRKAKDERWITDKHALARILRLVMKYGGALRVRSGQVELRYMPSAQRLKKPIGGWGYEPNQVITLPHAIPGTHYQIILPLVPHYRMRGPEESTKLSYALPAGFMADILHAKGHLVPLRECLEFGKACVGPDDYQEFRVACAKLSESVRRKCAAKDPVVLDFSGLEAWVPQQVEALLTFLQNLLITRPFLLVEMEPEMLSELCRLEEERAESFLVEMSWEEDEPVDRSQRFLQEWNDINQVFLAMDTRGPDHARILGLLYREYEPLLTGLIQAAADFEFLLAKHPEHDEGVLRGILNDASTLFECNPDGAWECVWSTSDLAVQSSRAIQRHFGAVALRSLAWRGCPTMYSDAVKKGLIPQEILDRYTDLDEDIFSLPWLDGLFREKFFECGRILSRERHADEIAQRLIWRLSYGLGLLGKRLADVTGLVGTTAPSLMLANAIRKWWPQSGRPPVIDVGHNCLFEEQHQEFPELPHSAGPTETEIVVVIQDVADTGEVSSRLIAQLRSQGVPSLCVLGFVKLVGDRKFDTERLRVQSTDIDPSEIAAADWWATTLPQEGWNQKPIPQHYMVHVRRPQDVPHIHVPRDLKHCWWVEPRTLRCFRYTTLLGEAKSRSESLDRASERRSLYDGPDGIVRVGHFAYGWRHYTSTILMREALTGGLGRMLADAIADLCLDTPDVRNGPLRLSRAWADRQRRGLPSLQGEVNLVLMPIHSQIHYLWEQVADILALRERRIPAFPLDATLFLGHGPHYRLPLQLEQQMGDRLMAMQRAMDAKRRTDGLRVLILDDAIVTSRTLQTILRDIERGLLKTANRIGVSHRELAKAGMRPIEWIKVVAVFNQLPHTSRDHWQNLTVVGHDLEIPFFMLEFDHVLGAVAHDVEGCSECLRRRRYTQLATAAQRNDEGTVADWATKQANSLRPIALDSVPKEVEVVHQPGTADRALEEGVQTRDGGHPLILLPPEFRTKKPNLYRATTHHAALWKFYELMYRSVPVGLILRACRNSMRNIREELPDAPHPIEHSRYRRRIYCWCADNWARLEASGGRKELWRCVMEEVMAQKSQLKVLAFELARYSTDTMVKRAVQAALRFIARGERVLDDHRTETPGLWKNSEFPLSRLVLRAQAALDVFFTALPNARIGGGETPPSVRSHEGAVFGPWHDIVARVAEKRQCSPTSYLRSLLGKWARPSASSDRCLGWSLRRVSEYLFRGTDTRRRGATSHLFLRGLLAKLADEPDAPLLRRRIECHVGLLAPALGHLENHCEASGEQGQDVIMSLHKRLREFLRELRNQDEEGALHGLPDSFSLVRSDIQLESEFCRFFTRVFTPSVEEILTALRRRAEEMGEERIKLLVKNDDVPLQRKVLFPRDRLLEKMENWAITEAVRGNGQFTTRIVVKPDGTSGVSFLIQTGFAGIKETCQRLVEEGKFQRDRRSLEMAGATCSKEPEAYEGTENGFRFTAQISVTVPLAYT